jgi:ornithine cyclodeaminase
MGAVLAQGGRVRREPQHITIADLTGLAIQDLQIAKGVLAKV